MTNDEVNQVIRHFDVVAESLEGKIATVAEGVVTLNEKVDRLDTRVEKLESKLDHLTMRVGAVETRQGALETKFDAFVVETRANFDELRASIKFSYAELDRRMTHLEAVVSDLATRVVRLEHPPGG